MFYGTLLVIYVQSYVSERNVAPRNMPVKVTQNEALASGIPAMHLLRARLPFPAGILRIPVFSVPVALLPQESGFLFRRNLFYPLRNPVCTEPTYVAAVGSYVGLEKNNLKISCITYPPTSPFSRKDSAEPI